MKPRRLGEFVAQQRDTARAHRLAGSFVRQSGADRAFADLGEVLAQAREADADLLAELLRSLPGRLVTATLDVASGCSGFPDCWISHLRAALEAELEEVMPKDERTANLVRTSDEHVGGGVSSDGGASPHEPESGKGRSAT